MSGSKLTVGINPVMLNRATLGGIRPSGTTAAGGVAATPVAAQIVDAATRQGHPALVVDDPAQLPSAVGLSRSSIRIIKKNLWVSLGVVVLLIPATIFGMGIATTAAFHEGSTLLVVANALRLLTYRSPAR